MKIPLVSAIVLFYLALFTNVNASECTPWSIQYQNLLMDKVGNQIKTLSTYPALKYPNAKHHQILHRYPNGKVLLFGYGSLINADSAGWSVSQKAVKSMRPVVAFGFKRIFNYYANNLSLRWGINLPKNERAMLNLEPTTTFNHIINGIVMEISHEDLHKLIQREEGYDLVPMLVADWNDAITQNPNVKIEIAYTFLVPSGLRNGVKYTEVKHYPVRKYLYAVQDGAAVFGSEFLNFWNSTTYLDDGTTLVTQWDEKTFSGILDSREP
jgi:hypothetical protein